MDLVNNYSSTTTHHSNGEMPARNYSSSFEDHKLLLVSLQRPHSSDSVTLHLFAQIGLRLTLVLFSALVVAATVLFCSRWLPRKAARYRRLSAVPGLREHYKSRAQCLLTDETDQQGSDCERPSTAILQEVTKI